eukprot:CAMPEP_0180181106 /NCGR_PEP_ID=MMETSP0986-20121125/39950_1 /TAXON_ID=697907 /ORGANISM="non described non described, Strain CCMP2293" /LENGTH=106 /DNA_ID=CAMNT_0022134375 /DNA_START=379 /DNA_END=701 /DNA_ORIENTATION=+
MSASLHVTNANVGAPAVSSGMGRGVPATESAQPSPPEQNPALDHVLCDGREAGAELGEDRIDDGPAVDLKLRDDLGWVRALDEHGGEFDDFERPEPLHFRTRPLEV